MNAKEARQFWCVASELRDAVRAGADPFEIDVLIDEAQPFADYAQSALIRSRARSLVFNCRRSQALRQRP